MVTDQIWCKPAGVPRIKLRVLKARVTVWDFLLYVSDYMCLMHDKRVWFWGSKKRVSEPLDLELQMAVHYHVDTGN